MRLRRATVLAREGVELLDADGQVPAVAGLVPRFLQLVRDLAGAQYEPPSVFVGRRVEVRDDAAEVAVAGEVGGRLDTALLWRSSDFGVSTISGLRKSRCICRRSAWK